MNEIESHDCRFPVSQMIICLPRAHLSLINLRAKIYAAKASFDCDREMIPMRKKENSI